jgi:hypothetical protein
MYWAFEKKNSNLSDSKCLINLKKAVHKHNRTLGLAIKMSASLYSLEIKLNFGPKKWFSEFNDNWEQTPDSVTILINLILKN